MPEKASGTEVVVAVPRGEAKRTHHVPWNQLWQYSNSILTQCCLAHRKWGALTTVMMMSNTLKQIILTGGLVLVMITVI